MAAPQDRKFTSVCCSATGSNNSWQNVGSQADVLKSAVTNNEHLHGVRCHLGLRAS